MMIFRRCATIGLSLCFALLATSRHASAQSVMWVQDGVAQARIVIADDPSTTEHRAAQDLQHHIGLWTGTTLPLIRLREARRLTDKPYLIHIGQAALAMRQPAADEPQLPLGSFRLSIQQDGAFLYGGHAMATQLAITHWLMDELGVRWVMPGELGITFPESVADKLPQASLSVRLRDERVTLPFEWWSNWPLQVNRPILEDFWGNPSAEDTLAHLRRLGRGQTGPTRRGGTNHSFYGYYTRFWEKEEGQEHHFVEKRPDWFAQGYGRRKPPQLCYTHPEVIAQVIQDLRDHFDGKGTPYKFYASLVPMDNSDFCLCERCKAAGSVGRPKDMTYGWPTAPNFSSNANSDYFFGFVNKVAKAIAQSHPDKVIGVLSYRDYAYPPREPLEPNVAVQICLDIRRHDAQVWQDQYDAWLVHNNHGREFGIWVYSCFPQLTGKIHHFTAFPGATSKVWDKAIKLWHQDGVKGWFHDGIPELADFYIATHLWLDPTQDHDALLREFFTRSYGGQAAQPLEAVYRQMQDAFLDPANYPDSYLRQTEAIAWDKLGTPQRIESWTALIHQAQQAQGTPAQKQRVGLFAKALLNTFQQGTEQWEKNQAQRHLVEALMAKGPKTIPVPRLTPQTTTPDQIDWSRAATLKFTNRMGGALDLPVNGKIAHDGRQVYIQLLRPHVQTSLHSHPNVFSGNSWEIFLAPSRDLPYYIFAANPQGQTAELAFIVPAQGGQPWTSSATLVNQYEPDQHRWLIHVAIPLAPLGVEDARPGTRIYANIFYSQLRAALGPTFEDNHHVLDRMVTLELK